MFHIHIISIENKNNYSGFECGKGGTSSGKCTTALANVSTLGDMCKKGLGCPADQASKEFDVTNCNCDADGCNDGIRPGSPNILLFPFAVLSFMMSIYSWYKENQTDT